MSRDYIEKNNREWLAAASVFLVAAAAFGLLFNRETTLSNEIGYNLLAAERVYEGQAPYVDFHTLYPPAIIYLNAAIFKLFGVTLYAALFGVMIFKVLTALIIYLSARSLMGRGWAVVTGLFSLIWLRPNGPFKAAPMQYGGLFLAASLFALLKYLGRRRLIYVWASGGSLGILALFKHNIGAYALAGSLAFILLESRLQPNLSEKQNRAYKALLSMLGGFALPVIPALFYMQAKGALAAMMGTLFFGPGEFLRNRLVLPHSPLASGADSLLFYGPVLIFIAAAAVLLFTRIDERAALSAVLICAAAAFLESFPRFAREQYIGAMPFVTLLLFYLLHLLKPRLERLAGPGIKTRLAIAIIPLLFLLVGARLLATTYFDRGLHFKSDTQPILERTRSVYFPNPTADLIERAVSYIQQRVPAGGYGFPQSREGSSLLFLADRKNPGAAQFWSGVGVTARERERTLQSLEEKQVKLVITSDKDLNGEQWGPMRDYLINNFKQTNRFGEIVILER